MAAAVARTARDERLTVRYVVLRKAGQRVEFAKNRDDRLALSPGADERRRDVGHLVLNRESGLPQLRFQQVGALVFLVSDLRELPDLAGDVAVMLGVGVHVVQDRVLLIRDRGAYRQHGHQGNYSQQHQNFAPVYRSYLERCERRTRLTGG